MSSLLLPDSDSSSTQRLVYTREFLEGLRHVPSDPTAKSVALNFIEREMAASLDLSGNAPNQARRIPYKSSFDAAPQAPYRPERRKPQPPLPQHQWANKSINSTSTATPQAPVMIQPPPAMDPHQTAQLSMWTSNSNVCESLFSSQPFSGLLTFPEQIQTETNKTYMMNRTDFIASGAYGFAKKSEIELASFQRPPVPVFLSSVVASQPAPQAIKALSLIEDHNPPSGQSRRTFASRGAYEDKENLLENFSMRGKSTLPATPKVAPRTFSSVVSVPKTHTVSAKKVPEKKSLPELIDEELLSSKSGAHHDPNEGKSPEEILAARMVSREKQIQYGYNTVGYQRYVATIPKDKRGRDMPRTPDKHQTCSKRSWDGQVRKWRRSLHLWDPAELQEEWIQKQLDAAREDEDAEEMVDKLIGDIGLGLDLADHHDVEQSDRIDFL